MISTPLLLAFYLGMTALGLGLCWGFGFGWPWRWMPPGHHDAPLWTPTPTQAVLLGAGLGLIVVLTSQLLERTTAWAKRLSQAFAQMLGPLSSWQVFLFALTSSVAEEILFRGFLQRALSTWPWGQGVGAAFGLGASSLIFGGIHVGSDRATFLPWTIMAIVLGGVLGWSYWWTGSLLAPIALHFTINFLNLSAITSKLGQHETDP